MPYQLHCWPAATLDTTELLALLKAIDDELAGTEELVATDETGRDEAADETLPPQILPVIVGRSALPPRLST